MTNDPSSRGDEAGRLFIDTTAERHIPRGRVVA
jgi:hypothetical protein